jgi:lysophospholipase L1-like esterase
MIGDSITDCGRSQPVGEGLFDALGKGYVSLVDSLLGTVYPDFGIRVVNMGSSGNTVVNLKDRWQRDVLDLQPDWLSIMVGANDVWRQFDSPTRPEQAVLLEEYEETLNGLIARSQPTVKNIILLTPFYIEPNRTDLMRAQMDEYGAVVKRLAAHHGVLLVDTQAAFDTVLQTYYPATLSWDRVHPNQTGHMIIARAFLKAIDFAW